MIATERKDTMDEKLSLLTELMNESLRLCGLPEISTQKTRVFVKMNTVLKTFTPEQMVSLTDDYGLILPAMTLSDVNIDYATLLQNKTEIDVSGFILYMDTFFIRMTNNQKPIMMHYTGIEGQASKEIRRQFIQDTLEEMINTRGLSKEEIIEKLISKGTPNDTNRRNI